MHARQAVSRSFLVVFIFLFMLALAGPAQAAPLAEPGSAAGVPILLQYTASGHVLGFAADKVYLAGLEHALTMAFVNGQSKTPTGEAAASSAGANGTPALGRVTYQDMWPGVDVVYTAAQGGLAESSYIIKAGANPEDIQLAYNTPAQLMADNRLCFAFESGYMTESAPVAFQEINGQRIPVAVRFRLNDGLVGFTLGHYNPEHALTIDPLYTWHAFYGSATWDEGYAVTSDASGNLYVAGYSDASWNGPGAKAPLNAHAGNHDIVVVKLNGAGAYQWHTFHGSDATDYGYAITNDANGNLYVAGYSYATWNGPGAAAPLNAHTGNGDITVLKLNSAGAYQWHTFHGSNATDYGNAITNDANGNLYVAGRSYATWNGPAAAAPLNTHAGNNDITVLKLNSAGTYQWHTFHGSTVGDEGRGITRDGSGNLYVAGYSNATWNGPGAAAPLNAHAGNGDITVLKLNSAGTYQWHTFHGASVRDEGYAIASDGSGNLYVAGYSDASWNGPGAKAPLNTHAGNHDIVVVKLNGTGAYQWHTFHGSNATDYGNAITNDANGNLYVAGYSYATWNGPGSAAPLNAHAGNNDITVLKLNSAGAYQWHTFHGSTESDYGYAVTQKGNGNLYVAGSSYATWNGPGAAAPLNTYSGTRDIVTLKLNISSPGIIVTSNADTQAADGLCTLREAILNSNHNDQSGSSDCPSGGGGTATITFSIPHPNTITLNSQLPAITDDLTIQGLGANQLTISGNDNDRVLSLNPGVFLTLNDLTIAHGQAPSGHGGGVEVAGGNLTVTDCVFSSNQAPGSGGAIHNGGGSLTIQDTTFSNNQADYGGAIASGEGVLSVTRSTFNGNSATTGGGAINNYLSTTHPVTVTSSTFYDNSATAHGGAVYNDNSGTLTIANSTFSVNSAPEGGSLSNAWGATLNVTNCTFSASGTSTSGTLRNFDGTVTLRNSILAYDGGDNCHNSDTLTANTYNLASDTSCGSAKLTTLANLKLGPLQNNGGSTQTMALLAGSSAIGAGNNNTCAFPVGAPSYGAGGYDQSGTHRPQGISCDSGAFEFQSTTSTFNSAGSQDGWVLESGENSAKGGSLDAAATTLRLGDDNARNQYRSILSFETSSLPDNAVIMKVVLKVKKQGVTGGGDPLAVFQGFKAGVKKGFFGTAAALAASDFQALASKTVGPFTPTPASGWYSLDLTGAKAYINKLNANGGLTQVRLFFTLGDNDNSLANYLSLYSGNAGAASRPKLIIEYYLP